MSALPQIAPGDALSNIEPGPVKERPWAEWFGPVDACFVLVLIGALVYLIHEGHGNKLFYDEWTWVETRNSGLSSILDSYNQHMEIVPSAVYELFFHTIGLNSYRWYRILATLGHLAVVVAVYLLARRRIGALALFIAAPLAFFGAGWEFILWGVNFGFTTSIALGVAALIWLEPDRRSRFRRLSGLDSEHRSSVVACLLLALSLMFTETALLFAIGIAVELTWRDRSLRRCWVWGVTVVLYAAWYLGFGSSVPGKHDLTVIPGFDAQLAAAASAGWFGKDESFGWVVLGVIAALLVWRLLRCGALTPRLGAVLVTVIGYWTLVAIGRAALGNPTASRYEYEGGVLLLLVVIESLSGIRLSWRSVAVFGVLCIFALDGGIKAFAPGESELGNGSNITAAELTALQLVKGRVPSTFVLDPLWAPQITPALYFPAVEKLHSTGADTYTQLSQEPPGIQSEADELLIRAGEVTIDRHASMTDAGSTAAPRVEFREHGKLSTSAGCVRYTPAGAGSTLDLTLPAGGLLIHVPATTASETPATEIFLRRFASQFVEAPIVSTRSALTVLIRARSDADPQPWHVRLSPWVTVTACTVAGSR